MSRVVHFEILAKEPQKVIDFYSRVLGWKFRKWDNPGPDYWLVETGGEQTPGINGGLASGDPVSAVVNTIGIADIDTMIENVEENGGKVVQPCVARPGMGWYASFEDPAGNQFGLLEVDPADVACPGSSGSEQQSLPGFSAGRAQPRARRTTGTRTASRTLKAPRQSPARTSRSGTRSPRPRTRASR